MVTYGDGRLRVGRSSLSLSHVSVTSSGSCGAGCGGACQHNMWRDMSTGKSHCKTGTPTSYTERGAIGGGSGGEMGTANKKCQAPLDAY